MRPTPRCANSMAFVRVSYVAAPQPYAPRNRVSTCCGTPLSLNGMHIYGVTVPGVHVTGERGREKVENWGRGREKGKEASAAAPSTCLAAPSGVTNLNGTLCAPIASACLLILTPHDFYRRRVACSDTPPSPPPHSLRSSLSLDEGEQGFSLNGKNRRI